MTEQELKKIGFETQEQYSFPNILNLCVLRGACPCQCVHCPVGITPKNERLGKFGNTSISLRLFKKIVREMSDFPHSTLRIHGVGDPILWKALAGAVRIAFENDVRTWLFTSLVTKDNQLLEDIGKYCDIIEISVNSFDEDDYKRTKRVDAFAQVKQNIELLRNTAKQEKASTRIIVSRVESEDKLYDLDFINYWKNSHLVDDAFIRTYHDYNALLENKFGGKQTEIVPCLVHWCRFNIDCDGTIVLCFNELFKGKHPDETLVLGNIENQTIGEIWHGEKLNLVRKAQMEKDYSLVNFTNKLPCAECFSCQSLIQKERPTSECQVKLLTGENHG